MRLSRLTGVAYVMCGAVQLPRQGKVAKDWGYGKSKQKIFPAVEARRWKDLGTERDPKENIHMEPLMAVLVQDFRSGAV